MNSGIQIRISDLLFALQKRWKVIIAGTCVGLVFGLMLSAMTFVQSALQTYEVSGSFSISTKGPNGLYVNGFSNAGNNDFHLAEDMVDAVIYVVRSDRVLLEAINAQQLLGTSVADLSKNQTVAQYSGTQIIEMTIVWDNADDGIALWNAIIEQANLLLPQTLQIGALEVINPAKAEALGIAGTGRAMPVILAVLGCIVGVGYAVMELLVRPTLNNVRDVETFFGLETIGVIPRDNAYYKKRSSLLVKDEEGTSIVEQNYSAAAYILRNRLGTKEQHHCFYVTSAVPQEGKSTVAANLAIQLSDMEHRTLLIDFDTRNPSLGSLFLENVDYARSLNALYSGDATEEEAITTLTGYLDILPAMLTHNVMTMDGTVVDLFRRLSEKYEYIILDAPPVGQVSDTLRLNQIASTVLFVIGYDTSTIPEIQNALEKLDKSGIRVLGCIVNGVQSTKNSFANNGDAHSDKKPRAKSSRSEKGDLFAAAEGSQDQAKEEDAIPLKPRNKKVFSSKAKKKEAVKSPKPGDAGETVPRKPRKNVMDDLLINEEKRDALTDSDEVSALLKNGVERDWSSLENKEGPEAGMKDEQPAAPEPAEEEAPAPSPKEEEKNVKPQRKPLFFGRKKREAEKEPEAGESAARQPDEDLTDGEETEEEKPKASNPRKTTDGLLKSLFSPRKREEAEKEPEEKENDAPLPRINVKDRPQQKEDQVTDRAGGRRPAANQFSDKEKLFAAIKAKQQAQAKAEEEKRTTHRREAFSARMRREEEDEQPQAPEIVLHAPRENPMEDLPCKEEETPNAPDARSTEQALPETVPDGDWDEKENEEAEETPRNLPPVIRRTHAAPAEKDSAKQRGRSRRAYRPNRPRS